jgi:hypothetical protein
MHVAVYLKYGMHISTGQDCSITSETEPVTTAENQTESNQTKDWLVEGECFTGRFGT